MRVADRMNYDQVNGTINKNRSEMNELQNQAASQKKVTKPSDDPLAATRILSTRTELANGNQFLKSISEAKSFIEYSEQSLGELSDILGRAKELAISQSNDASADKRTRQIAGGEVQNLHDEVVQVSNRKFADRYLFSGYKTTQKPFDQTGRYSGDSGEIKISVQKEGAIAMNMPGSRIFLGKNIHGLSNAEIDVVKKAQRQKFEDNDVTHDSPELGGHIRRPASVESSLLTERSPSAVDIKSTDSVIDQDEHIDKVDGTNVFKVLQDLATALNANDKSGVQDSLDKIDDSLQQVVQARASLGSRISTLTGASETLQKGKVEAKTLVSNLEDADTFELVSDINKTESTLKASLQTSGKLIQPSLLDFLR